MALDLIGYVLHMGCVGSAMLISAVQHASSSRKADPTPLANSALFQFLAFSDTGELEKIDKVITLMNAAILFTSKES